MKSIRVKNLRSLKDTKEIGIKKINILVGGNSSGKSTFLRIFPLLKQSFNKKIKNTENHLRSSSYISLRISQLNIKLGDSF